MVHTVVARVEITFKNGESTTYALCESADDFIIAHGYHRASSTWDSGIYMPKFENFTEVQALKNFVADVESIANHEWTESVRF